jgi:ATP-dependent Lon protease
MEEHGLPRRPDPWSREAVDRLVASTRTRPACATSSARSRDLPQGGAAGRRGRRAPLRVTPRTLPRFLGPAAHLDVERQVVSEVGVANGLAWTESGGDLLRVEARRRPARASC